MTAPSLSLREPICASLRQRTSRVTLLLENLVDSANASACTRTCEALGLSSIHVIESYEPFRTSMGVTMNADKWIDIHKYRHFMDGVTRLKSEGYTLVATCLDEEARDIGEVDFAKMDKICIVLGNEQRGLSFAMRDVADVKVKVPMVGMSQSLNISTSCGIFVHHLRSLGLLTPNLTDGELAGYYQKWLILSTKNAMLLLRKHGFEGEVSDYV
jgi:tRNA (guanosine-2'-O-)-methyltransferase